MDPVTFGLIMAGTGVLSSLIGGGQQASAMEQQMEEMRKNREAQQQMNAQNFMLQQKRMAMDGVGMLNSGKLGAAATAALYGAPGQAVNFTINDPNQAGGGGGGAGTCPGGKTYVRKEAGDKSPDGRTLVAGEEYCM